jgi:hypothetical protein
MSLSTAHSARVFSAGGQLFKWVEWVRARGEWAALRQRLAALLARERNWPRLLRCPPQPPRELA